ncbi:MAG TPA: PKD domain-containing protein [Chitinophagaceae bacterium]|nr:PKD domain-containing protein [Chitinophagaceae bacterium]
MIRNYHIALILALLTTTLHAQTGNIEFIENKGQWNDQVKFKSDIPAGNFFIRSSGFTVLQHNENDLKQLQEVIKGHQVIPNGKSSSLILRSHAYHVDFLDASPHYEIIPDKLQTYYNNYFIGNDQSKWAANCKIYQGVTLKNVYPNVDVRYYTENGRMKYDIVVKPGADLKKIALKYTGADKLEIKNKELLVKTSVGEVKEMDPFTYQYENNQRKQVSSKYILKGNEVRFDIRNYNASEVLIIDPTLIFVSFSGSTGDNWGYTATYGPDGSFYGGGINNASGFPVSTGAFQTTYGGGSGQPPSDISIIKLSPNGTSRIYATYIGGSGEEQPHSLIVDGAGNLVIAGRSNSSNYPTTGAGVLGTGGGYDIVVTKLNAGGTALLGSKKIGGTGDDGVNINPTRNGVASLQQNYGDDGRSEVILDGSGNIYVASCSRSVNFPVTGGAFQTVFGGGSQDGVLLKMDPGVNSLIFASYLGGNADDAAYVLSLAPNDNIYVAGGTASTNFPGNTAGTIGTANQGGIDGFVSIVSNNGNSLLSSTYLGTSGTDQVYGIQFDKFGFPYVTGQTGGAWPLRNAAFSNTGAPQFIAKLQPDLSDYIYSTTFGRPASTPNISITAFLVDNCENVYVSGWGGDIRPASNPYNSSSTTGMPVTSDAIKSVTDGSDFYFFVLKKNAASQLFGSFFGQTGGFADHVDGGTSRFDQQGVIYQAVCANCGGGAVFPTTPGVAFPNNGAAPTQGCNLGMIKISFDFSGVNAGFVSSINGVLRDTTGCVPLTVDFIDTVANAVTYYWNFGDASPVLVTNVPNSSHTYNLAGLYKVMLIAEDSTTCNIRDTAYINIRVGDLIASIDFNPVKLASCDSLKYRFDNLSVAPVTKPFTNQSFRWEFGDGSPSIITGTAPVFHSYASPGSYIVKLYLRDTSYCNYLDSVVKTISIAPQVKAQFTTPPSGCVPYTAAFTNTSIAGQTFIWDFGDGTSSTSTNPSHLYTIAGTYTITLIANDPNTCNLTDTTRVTINVYNNPVSNFSFAPDPPVENTGITFTNLASADAIRFKWLFGDGDSLLTTSRTPITHLYNTTGTFDACLVATNAAGCSDTYCQQVKTIILPAVDVPNAFTPNSGDINSKIFVRSFGVVKLKFIIWNRWGQKVFETNDRQIGWDGKYKGVLQPMDVYAYTIEAEFFDGTRATKKGDITLIR